MFLFFSLFDIFIVVWFLNVFFCFMSCFGVDEVLWVVWNVSLMVGAFDGVHGVI